MTGASTTIATVTLAAVQRARERIRGFIYESPCRASAELSQMTRQETYLKLDNLQRTGAFKERGALNKILTLSNQEKQRGVITASAGNHAQAVAYHACARGIQAQIVMPLMTPLVKVAATKGFGAEVVLHGANYDEAYAFALESCAEQRMTFLHPFDDAEVINGQGSIGLELLEQVPGLEAVVVPHRRRRADRRRGVRHQGEQSKNSRGRGADRAATFDAPRNRGGTPGDHSGIGDGGRWHRGTSRGRRHVASGAALRRRDRYGR